MALITITGYPSSGKSRRASEIKDYIEQRLSSQDFEGPKLKVSLISDETVNLERNVYDDSRSEKLARGALFTSLTRQLAKDTIVIIDSLNYIKGFRYQMYCAAREAEVRTCTVFVVATPEECKAWNSQRDTDLAYAPETFDNLIQRYEEPNSMARWDSPLYTISWTDDGIPGPAIWDTILSGNKPPPNAGVVQVVKPPTDALQILETVSVSIVNMVVSSGLSSQGGTVPIPLSPMVKLKINLPPRSVTLAELQRHKRQFVSVHKKTLTQGNKGGFDWSEEVVADKFVEYLEEQLSR